MKDRDKFVPVTPVYVVEKKTKYLSDDPLLSLAGVFESDVTDVTKEHNKYIGEEIRNDN